MTRFIHDRFAKEYLEELLSPKGKGKCSKGRSSHIPSPTPTPPTPSQAQITTRSAIEVPDID